MWHLSHCIRIASANTHWHRLIGCTLLSRGSQTNSHFPQLIRYQLVTVHILACQRIHINESSCFFISLLSFSSLGFLRDFEIPRPARLKFIYEPMHRETLPTLSQRLEYRLRVSDIIDRRAHSLLDEPREDLRMRRSSDEPPGELNEWPKPALEHMLDMWRRRVRHGR